MTPTKARILQMRRPPNETHIAILKSILDTLPERERRVLADYFQRDIPEQELCDLAGMGIGRFREIKSQVRRQFEAAIAEPRSLMSITLSPLEILQLGTNHEAILLSKGANQ